MTTRIKETDKTSAAKKSVSMTGRFVGFAKSQKATPSNAASNTKLANGESVGP
jgi:hypothetical protein